MLTKDLFNNICEELRARNKIPDLVDSIIVPCGNVVVVIDDSVKLGQSLEYGEQGGICLDFWLTQAIGAAELKYNLGRFVSEREDDEAMAIMGMLAANFTIVESSFIKSDSFSVKGIFLYPLDSNGNRISGGLFFDDSAEANKCVGKLLKEYPRILLNDCQSNKNTIIARGGYKLLAM